MSDLFQEKYRTKSTRLPGWDYSADGYYFVTINTHDREHHFGKIENGKMKLSAIGEIVDAEWLQTEKIRANVRLDAWVIMPDHLHGILIIKTETPRDIVVEMPRDIVVEMPRDIVVEMPQRGVFTKSTKSTKTENPHHKPEWKPNSVGSIINQFKGAVTKRIHKIHPAISRVWQPRFHDHIIRNEEELHRIREYILNNPANWGKDRNNLR